MSSVDIFKARDNDVNRQNRNIHTYPAAAEGLSRINLCSTATKRIKDDIAFMAGGFDNAFQKGKGFLSRIAKTLLCILINDGYFLPIRAGALRLFFS